MPDAPSRRSRCGSTGARHRRAVGAVVRVMVLALLLPRRDGTRPRRRPPRRSARRRPGGRWPCHCWWCDDVCQSECGACVGWAARRWINPISRISLASRTETTRTQPLRNSIHQFDSPVQHVLRPQKAPRAPLQPDLQHPVPLWPGSAPPADGAPSIRGLDREARAP
jgi:hypothetical protein